MADKRESEHNGERDISLSRIYSLLCALKLSVDRLAVQVKALKNLEQEVKYDK